MISRKIILKIIVFLAMVYGINFMVVAPVSAVTKSTDLWSMIQAGGLLDIGKYGYQMAYPDQPKGIPVIAGQTINTLLGLLGIIFVVLIVYSGYLWMTAGGNEEQVGTAKDILKNAIIGVLLILAAYSITIFILRTFMSSTGGTGKGETIIQTF